MEIKERNKMSKKTWLITGGFGFIGANLCEQISIAFPADKIVIIDNLSSNAINISVSSFNTFWHNIDIFDYEKVKEVFKKEKPDYVVHLAAKTDVRESLKNPYETLRENWVGLLNCINIAYYNDVKHFIFASSCGVVGDVEVAKEDSPINPQSPYTISKAVGESICDMYSKMNVSFRVSALRFSNVYGKYSAQKGSVIPKFINNILNGEFIAINGDGEQTRDFICVEDIAKAMIKVIENKCEGVFCVSTFQKTSINEIVEILAECYGNSINKKYSPAIEGEVINSIVDNSKIKKAIEFEFDKDVKKNICDLFNWFLKEAEGI